MKLLDFISLFDENKKIDVWKLGEDNYLLTFYDGKNSIDEKFNNCEIKLISSHFDEIDETTVVDLFI